MDLFYSTLTTKQQLNKFKNESKEQLNVEYNWRSSKSNKARTSFKIISGNTETIGNCVMFIIPHITSLGFMMSKKEKALSEKCSHMGINNSIFTYCYPAMVKSISRAIIKESVARIELLISIINPKLIISVGVEPTLLFMGRKPVLSDAHGKIVCDYNGIPVILTYDMEYYYSHSGYESQEYKNSIMNSNWEVIKEQYNEHIGE